MSKKFPVGTYFYPHTNTCPIRSRRMAQFGHNIINEPLLVQQTEPLFDGHRQPRTYCLGDAAITQWDDADEQAMIQQVELMREAQLDFVIFDSYGGSRQGGTTIP